MAATCRVEVCCAFETRYLTRAVAVDAGTTLAEAVEASGIEAEPGLPDWRTTGLSVFGQRRRAEDAVADGDRIELARPLLADPKDARRSRVQRERAAGPGKWRR